jgi:5-methylcytosine-specific restriction protein A
VEGFDARAYLQSLTGQTITTVTGRPNTVVAVQGDEVLVRTMRNEATEGDRVPVQWVQDAADDLFANGEIGINVKEASYRSSFVGAVLATLPGAKAFSGPSRVVLDDGSGARRNPPWEYDELVLALDVYFREPRARQSKGHPAVADLSRVLRALPLPIERPDPERFRNVNGVFMKLQNFKAVDPVYTADGRTGLGAGATQRERTLFERFVDKQDELGALAQQIRDRVEEGGEALPGTPEEGEEGSVEGRVLYRVHKTRERRRSEEKKRAVLRATGRLECEVCGFDFLTTYGERGRGFAECHHKLPLSDGTRTTYLRDLAIVCANCHRMLHRGDLISVEELRGILDQAS